MQESAGCFIDFEQTSPGLSDDAVLGGVRYRKRPPDVECLHWSVDFGKPERRDGHTMVACVCLGCGLVWAMCKVLELKGAT